MQRPPYGQTDICKNIALPQTSFAGGNELLQDVTQYVHPVMVLIKVSLMVVRHYSFQF